MYSIGPQSEGKKCSGITCHRHVPTGAQIGHDKLHRGSNVLVLLCVFQVTIWVERHTGQVVCTSTRRCLSDQARVASETFLGPTSFSMQATCATSTTVSGLGPKP